MSTHLTHLSFALTSSSTMTKFRHSWRTAHRAHNSLATRTLPPRCGDGCWILVALDHQPWTTANSTSGTTAASCRRDGLVEQGIGWIYLARRWRGRPQPKGDYRHQACLTSIRPWPLQKSRRCPDRITLASESCRPSSSQRYRRDTRIWWLLAWDADPRVPDATKGVLERRTPIVRGCIVTNAAT
jgi:hypothetical protein